MLRIEPPSERARRILLILVLVATAAELLSPVLAGALASPAMRVALGHDPSPLGGAAEAGMMGSAIWLVFEA